MTTIKPGDFIGSRYEVFKVFGGKRKTGMGILYACKDLERNETLILKTFQDKYINHERTINKFKHEALTWILLGKHPNIVNAKYVIKLDNKIYVALEYIPPDEQGRHTLQDFLEEKISFKQALEWSLQFCWGMEYAFNKGIITHFDIKPSNIMITKDKTLKISDFGLAKIWDEQDIIDDWEVMTEECPENLSFVCVYQEKKVTGSALWMAPERYEGEGDIRSDIYSFGVVMYQMVNEGKLPFAKQTLKSYYLNVKNQPIQKVVTDLYPIIEKCLQKKPMHRFQTFTELKEKLEALYQEEFGNRYQPLEIQKEIREIRYKDKGISFLTLGLHKEAKKYFQKALKQNPNDVECLKHFAITLKRTGQLEKSIDLFKKIISNTPESIDIYFELADAYRQIGDFSSSIDQFNRILEKKPQDIKALYQLGKTYQSQGDLTSALNIFSALKDRAALKHTDLRKEVKKHLKKIKKSLK
ncbi:MAG: serine/threonine-protein kinase [Promethearchaeota archaeon]|nr:MAG: serine/threonine-protein kinase [Candidatus Lokiarchaeota archaeon]